MARRSWSDDMLLSLLLFVLGQGGRAAADSSASKRFPRPDIKLPPDIDVYEEPSDRELLEPPEVPSADDLLWAQYAGDTSHPHPLHQIDSRPVSRKLSRFERWALSPYFPVAEDLDVTLNHGDLLELIPGARKRFEEALKLYPEKVKSALEVLKRTQAFTAKNPVRDGKVEIFVPRLSPLYTRWWLSVLGHELAHVSQYRMGLSAPQILDALGRHGYLDSPIEQQARTVQRQVLRGLTMRARNYYRDKGR